MANSVGGTTTTDSSAAAWEQGTLSAAESYADAQADAESAARSKAEAEAAAAANTNATDGVTTGQSSTSEPAPGDGFGPTAAQRAQSAFWGHDTPPGTGVNAPPKYISNEEAQQLREAGFVVETDAQGRNTVPPQAGNDVILQGSGGGLPAPSGTPTTTNAADPGGPAPRPTEVGPNTAPAISGPDEPGAAKEPAKIVSKLGPEVDDLINRSPTLRRKWEAAVKAGWKIEVGRSNERSNAQPKDIGSGGKIFINLNDVKPGGDQAGKLTSLLSHEIGHVVSGIKPVIQADNKADFVSKNTERAVNDEGNAAFENARTRDEIRANGGRDIGIRGGLDDQYIAIYDRFKAGVISEGQARAEMAQVQGREQGTLDEKGPSRRQLYEEQYSRQWDKAHPN